MNQPNGLLPRNLLLRKVLLSVIAAGAVAGLAFFGWSAKAKDDATFHLANGIQVTPVEVQPDDTAQLLEVRTWKFDIVQPDASKPLYLSLNLCHEGKFARTLIGGLGSGPPIAGSISHRPALSHIAVSIAPIGDTLFGSRQLKYLLRTDGAGTSGTMPNPIFRGNGEAADVQASPADNSVFLTSTNQHKPYVSSLMASNDTILALRVSNTPPR